MILLWIKIPTAYPFKVGMNFSRISLLDKLFYGCTNIIFQPAGFGHVQIKSKIAQPRNQERYIYRVGVVSKLFVFVISQKFP